MMLQARNSFRLKSEIGIKLWTTWMVVMWTSLGLEKVLQEKNKASSTVLGFYGLKQHKP
jgi:hypothetical protein